MTNITGECEPQLSTPLNQWLDCVSFALMATERVVALALSLTHNNLAAAAAAAKETQNVPDVVQQFSVQCRIAASMAEMAACQAQMLQELADDLNRELAYFISETTAATRRALK
ncbi:MAG TPA: hypothetical protein PKD04_01755 [Rhodocyclaceae bacterium]|jgi:hypothetical protein|nr:hypothetical protein [Betaproteobacteria bacterium]HMU99774.1 hypothetical protein [Rhodocyclaceae bacterium]HMV21972.1 hypothetical protein [Rhodocyclaceae bacterium]HMW77407.1 hypothetical protein [Rhodocyclaceae bacterium]HNE43596.1 hypothetical protein [Rhodocyclaceae bacterium]